MFQNRLFFALASRSGFEPAISDPVARSSILFCNSVSADRIVIAASRLLHAEAACVILLSFAAGLRKSYWSGCMKAATVICQQISSILAVVIFLLKILLKSGSKSSFFRFGVEIRFWSYNFPTPLHVGLEQWSVGREECSVKCAVWRKQWEVRSVKCGVWSLSLECEGSSEKWQVWSVECEVWSLIFFSLWLLANNKAWQMQFLCFGIEIRFWKLVLYSLRQCTCSFRSARLCANCACSRRRCLGHACE